MSTYINQIEEFILHKYTWPAKYKLRLIYKPVENKIQIELHNQDLKYGLRTKISPYVFMYKNVLRQQELDVCMHRLIRRTSKVCVALHTNRLLNG